MECFLISLVQLFKLALVIATLLLQIAFISVDFPTLAVPQSIIPKLSKNSKLNFSLKCFFTLLILNGNFFASFFLSNGIDLKSLNFF